MVIQNNIPALNAYRNFGRNNAQLSKNLEKLSSGYRINRAGDDAAGLAISEKMRAQISGLEQARRNVRDGINLIQTGEGALSEVQDMLNRVKTLSEQAANGTYADLDRERLQDEITQISEEVDRISNTTNFNGIQLFQNMGLSAESSDSLDTDEWMARIADLYGSDGTNIVIGETTFDETLYNIDEYATTQKPIGVRQAIPAKYQQMASMLETSIVPQVVNSIMNTYTAFSYLRDSDIAIGLELFNDARRSTMASVVAGLGRDSNGKPYMTLRLSVNAAYVGDLTKEAGRSSLERTISHEMIHAFMDETHTTGMFVIYANWRKSASEAYPIWFVEGMAQTASGPGNWVFSKNGLGLRTTMTNRQISRTLLKSDNYLHLNHKSATYGTGYLACMYLGYLADGRQADMGNSASAAQSIARGLSRILGDLAKGDSFDTVISRYTGFRSATHFAMSFHLLGDANNFVRKMMPYCSNGKGGILSGNLASNNPVPNDDLSGINIFKLNTRYAAMYNQYPSGVTVLSGGTRFMRGSKPVSDYTYSALLDANHTHNDVGADAALKSGGVVLQIGTKSTDRERLEIPQFYLSSTALGLDKLNISTQEGAVVALDSIDSMIERVSTIRGTYGALQNRLEHTYNNLGVMRENMQDAESTIRDTDMAEEMMKYTKNSILVQSAQSMLAQANQNPQSILSLIQG